MSQLRAVNNARDGLEWKSGCMPSLWMSVTVIDNKLLQSVDSSATAP